ncbi:MAG TPA: serine hydrolase domain-containing protein [Candidatus Limnocylindrales bacterium]|nr:serine hydrolase domain-containing protein [Candidatus Limnocylindrales bacterium]
MTHLDSILGTIDSWGADHAAAAVVGPDGVIAQHGDRDRAFRWASVTKIAIALAALSAVDDGTIDLDEAMGPPGSTIRHLLAHTSGLPFDGEAVQAKPGARRIYSNAGFDLLGRVLQERDERPIAVALTDRVLAPLGMAGTELRERPSQGLHGPLVDAAALARELLRPTLVTRPVFEAATSVAFPTLKGVLPGVGPFDPLDWGLGFEIRDAKTPHWTGTRNSPRTFGHFGGAGTFIWVDPVIDRALVVLTDREFDRWALGAWPPFSDSLIGSLLRDRDGESQLAPGSEGSGAAAGADA